MVIVMAIGKCMTIHEIRTNLTKVCDRSFLLVLLLLPITLTCSISN